MKPFSAQLQNKINRYLEQKTPVQMGRIQFSSPLILAPMAGITDIPFRLLMQDLGAGCTISELIASTGLHFNSEKTNKMLAVSPLEKCVGLQLFGDNPEHMAEAAVIAEERGAHFVDINMGCPVNKVVKRGAGSALLIEPKDLYDYLRPIKEKIKIPLTIKIRTGWDKKNLTAGEIVKIAKDLEIEWVAIHGRTREQHYSGFADWDFLENLAKERLHDEKSDIPLIGNGDLNTPPQVWERLNCTEMNALMLGRGPLRNPFLFLEGLDKDGKLHSENGSELAFTPGDYLEVIERLYAYQEASYDSDHIFRVNFRKLLVWFAAGFPNATHFRGRVFTLETVKESLNLAIDFFSQLEQKKQQKQINYDSPFMNGGHG